MNEVKIEKKKRGRPKADTQWTSAERQAQTRGKAHSALLNAELDTAKHLISEMSTSNLISALPLLMAEKRKLQSGLLPQLPLEKRKLIIRLVCDELVNRVNK